MNRSTYRVLLLATLAGFLAACASVSSPVVKRDAQLQRAPVAGTPGDANTRAKGEPLPP